MDGWMGSKKRYIFVTASYLVMQQMTSVEVVK